MRYELADYEWIVIKPMLPNKPRGIPRVNDRRVLNGIFWVLRSGAPWRDLPEMFGPYTTCYNRFVRWRRAGVWGGFLAAFAVAPVAVFQLLAPWFFGLLSMEPASLGIGANRWGDPAAACRVKSTQWSIGMVCRYG
jgi:hypothetical protein